jgi:hypothetical protein
LMIVHHCCVLLHLPFPRYSDVLLWFLLLLWIWLLDYYTRNVYSFGHDGVVKLYWHIQQRSNGGERVLGGAKDCWAGSKLKCVLQWARGEVLYKLLKVIQRGFRVKGFFKTLVTLWMFFEIYVFCRF